MAMLVGLVSGRAELVVDVAALVAEAGGTVVVPDGPRWSARSAAAHDAAATREVAPALVVVDALAATDLPDVRGTGSGPRRAPQVIVVHRLGEDRLADSRADAVGADHVVALPSGRAWLAEALRPGEAEPPVVAVIGATGGAGTTTVAIALAAAAPGGSLLVDLDPVGTGMLPLGLEQAPGVRWPDLPDAGAALDVDSFVTALPRRDVVRVVCGPAPPRRAGRVSSVVATARASTLSAVLDLGRRDEHGVLGPADVAVIVTPSSVAGAVGARRVMEELPVARCVIALRDFGWVPPGELAAELGDAPTVRVPTLRRAAELAECGQLLTGSTGRALEAVGAQLWEFAR